MDANYMCGLADGALEQHRLAKASGDPAAIASTRVEVLRIKRELEHVKSERDTLALVKVAMRSPLLLGTR
jgi:hypothetical protein